MGSSRGAGIERAFTPHGPGAGAMRDSADLLAHMICSCASTLRRLIQHMIPTAAIMLHFLICTLEYSDVASYSPFLRRASVGLGPLSRPHTAHTASTVQLYTQ